MNGPADEVLLEHPPAAGSLGMMSVSAFKSLVPRLVRAISLLYPAEYALILFGALTVVLYRVLGLGLRDPLKLYLPRAQSALAWYLTGLGLALLFKRLGDLRDGGRLGLAETWRRYKSQHLTPNRLIEDLRLLNAVALCFVVFLNLKHLIPFVNPSSYDPILEMIERPLFGGMLAAEALQQLFGSKAAPLLSAAYMFFYPYMALLILAVLFSDSGSADRRLFILRFVLVWLLGVLMVYLIPSWGPCFYLPETTANLPATEVAEVQARLWRYRLYLAAHPIDTKGIYIISGLPSLHLAIPLLGSLELSRIGSRLASLSWLFTAVTCCSTIYFAWHYAADHAAAALLVLFVIRATSRGARDVG